MGSGNIHENLLRIVEQAESSAAALQASASAIAECLDAEACAIYVLRKNRLEPRARFGPAPELAVSLAESALRADLPSSASTASAAVLAVPVMSINQAIGAIVMQRQARSPFTAEETMRLSGVASQMVALLESASLLEAIGASGADRSDADDSVAPPSTGERILRGLPAAPGVAIGVAVFRNAFPRALARQTPSRGATVETQRARDAFQKTSNDLTLLQSEAASEIGEEQALIFGSHLMLLHDPMFTGLVDTGIAGGASAASAVDSALAEIVRRLKGVGDPYIEERVEDVEDLRTRVLGHLVGVERKAGVDARIVVSLRLTPSLLIELKARGALGIASELGGITSHGVVLARALGVPAVAGVQRLTHEILAGDVIIVDGSEGHVVIRPTADTQEQYARRVEMAERTKTSFLTYRDRAATTADGLRFELQANVALGSDLDIACENRADGIGLYRTEFPFIVRDALPTVEEQGRIYARAYAAFPAGPVTFRLLDLAGDKFILNHGPGASRDAFHGYRSIRLLFDYPHVLRDQVQAFAIAADGRPLRILIPMVTSVDDVVRIKGLVAAALAEADRPCDPASVVYGAMVETPAAVELITELAREVEFFSIGTNDLIQYTLVVDREDSRMTSERQSYHPAIARMIRRVVMAAHEAGKRVSVCGEMAARPDIAIALLALGVDALSVAPRLIPKLKSELAVLSIEPLRSHLDGLLALSTADLVAEALRRYVSDGSVPTTLVRSG